MPLKLYAPGERKSNRYFVIRGSIRNVVYERSTYTTDRKLAKRRLEEFAREITAAPASPDKITFAEAARRYVEFRSPSKYDRRRVERVVAYFGSRRLREIRAGDVHEAANKMAGHLLPATRNRQILRPIVCVLHYAATAGLCEYVRVPAFREPRVPSKALDAATASALIGAANPRLRRLLVWLFFQGTRITATLAIDWRQIDLQQQTVTIYNGKGNRFEVFPLHEAVIAELGDGGIGRVFHWSRTALHRELEALEKVTGVHFTPHMARHTLGTMMAQNRETTRAIMAALGHTTPMMSMRYQAADVEMVRAALNRVQLPQAKNLGRSA